MTKSNVVKKAIKAAMKVRAAASHKRTTLGYTVFKRQADADGDESLIPLELVEIEVGKRTVQILDVTNTDADVISVDGFATRGSAQAAINRTLKYSERWNRERGYGEHDFVIVKSIG